MAMAVDSRQHQLPMNSLSYDQMRYVPPQFTNPWTASTQTNSLYAQSMPFGSSGLSDKVSAAGQLPHMATSGPQLSSNPFAFDHTQNLSSAPMMNQRSYGQEYSSPVTTQSSAYAPTSAPYATAFSQGTYSTYGQDTSRPNYTQRAPQVGRENFNDALDASRNMLAMSSQTDLTPRNIYGSDVVRQVSQDAYGFPATHSAHSSISSASGYPYAYGSSLNSSINGSITGSVDGSVTDYSSAGEEPLGSRTLPRPVGYMSGSLPPAASSMMSQFNSKVSPSTQKKHKCKICDKRFTRPSSLQTHMYSHTGEKPFACDAEGCGRHFSVVSNLRRHKKVHRGEGDHPSPDDE